MASADVTAPMYSGEAVYVDEIMEEGEGVDAAESCEEGEEVRRGGEDGQEGDGDDKVSGHSVEVAVGRSGDCGKLEVVKTGGDGVEAMEGVTAMDVEVEGRLPLRKTDRASSGV